MELQTLIIYDIENDGIRSKISEVCKDYGLERIQFSAFWGKMSRNRREEIGLRIKNILPDGEKSKILIIPICEKDFQGRQEIIIDRDEDI